MKVLKGVALFFSLTFFVSIVGCSHDKVMRDYYRSLRDSEMAKMAAIRSYIRSNQARQQTNMALINKVSAGNNGRVDASMIAMIAMANAMSDSQQSHAVGDALETWYGQKPIQQPVSEFAQNMKSISWLATPVSIVAGGWAAGYVLDRATGTISDSYNSGQSNNMSGSSTRDVTFRNEGDAAINGSADGSSTQYNESGDPAVNFCPECDEEVVSPGTTEELNFE